MSSFDMRQPEEIAKKPLSKHIRISLLQQV